MSYLPTENTPNIKLSKFIWSTIIPLIFVLLINIFFAILFSFKNPNRGYEVVQHKWKLAAEKKNVDWLILGDSAGNQGFNNTVFDSLLDCTSLNLCTIGPMLVSDDVWLLEQYLERNNPPKNILIVHTYDVLQRKTMDQQTFNQIPKLKFEPSLSLPYSFDFFSKWFPLSNQHRSIKKLLLNPKSFFNTKQKHSDQGQHIIQNHSSKLVETDFKYHCDLSIKEPVFEVSSNNLLAIERLASLAEKNEVKIYFADAPLYEKMMVKDAFINKYNDYKIKMMKLCSKYNIDYLDQGPHLFKSSDLESSIDHLIYPASAIYTQHISNVILQKL